MTSLPEVANATPLGTALRMADGTQIYARDLSGSGRPVILTHAWPLSADIWCIQAAALAWAGHALTARGIPGARMIEYEGASHGLVITKQERVSVDLSHFLAA